MTTARAKAAEALQRTAKYLTDLLDKEPKWQPSPQAARVMIEGARNSMTEIADALSAEAAAVPQSGPIVWGLDIGALSDDPRKLKVIIAEKQAELHAMHDALHAAARQAAAVPADREGLARRLDGYPPSDDGVTLVDVAFLREAASALRQPAAEEVEAMAKRLEAPHYWMSGSDAGHEGENDAPREAAALLRRLSPPADGWRPISEPLKDGTIYLTHWGDLPVMVSWSDVGQEDCWRVLMPMRDGRHYGIHGNYAPFTPKQFWELPAPPSSEEATA